MRSGTRRSAAGLVLLAAAYLAAPAVHATGAVRVTVTVKGKGHVTGGTIHCPPRCSAVVVPGRPLTLRAAPVAGYRFAGWSRACTGVRACVLHPRAATRVIATFGALPPPPPPPLAGTTVGPTSLTAPATIDHLAADGGRVAYSICGHVYVWTPAARALASIDGLTVKPCTDLVPPIVSGLAVAGDRVLWETVSGGNLPEWFLHGVTLGSPPTALSVPKAGDVCCAGQPLNGILGDLAGSGSLLVFSSWDTGWQTQCCTNLIVTQQRIERVEATGCPCPVIETQPGPIVPFDVDGGRILAGGDNATLLLDADGNQLQQFPVAATAGALSGNDAVLLVAGGLRDYAADSGALLHSWPVPGVLQDAARGLVLYVAGGQLHLLRLSDGADATIGAATAARFTDTGVVYADGATLRTVDSAALPLH